ncbi:anthranilate synthase component I [Bacillaceae bacterium SIJ1]|uniref:anthranilate synthase component I family protein n=1 Tax=Litoribacterium kuwaitense TaxID=1398745 RepID=UPI0013ED3C83|nr:chorismate-binding protein [Litoribacterium kuwaitense]NGP43710.1 anthranilate synthase component I [Litoribacterium kuwaitense]
MKTLQQFIEEAEHYDTIPLVKEYYVDQTTPIHMFTHLQDTASYLLESRDEQSLWSKHSFIGLHETYAIVHQESHFQIKKENKVIESETTLQDAFASVQKLQNLKPLESDLPFSGGGVGYMAYEAAYELETVRTKHGFDGQKPLYHFIFCEIVLAYHHHNGRLEVICYVDVQNKDRVKEIYAETIKRMDDIVSKATLNNDAPPHLLTPTNGQEVEEAFAQFVSNYAKDSFLHDVKAIQEWIKNGDIFQAVLSQRFTKKTEVSGLELYRSLRMINPSPYMFYIVLGETEIIGSSPEKLVEVQQGEIEIHPIAGTRPRGQTKREDEQLGEELKNDEKERAEHHMLVDLARNDVGRVAAYGSVHTPVLLELAHFSHVMHLISKVRGQLAEGFTPFAALNAGFPAGTVSGSPKIRAMEIINELEPTSRGIYAGAICYIGYNAQIDSCIAIRTMTLEKGTVTVQAGAGVVADSVPEMEWEETRNKALGLVRAIDHAEKQKAEGSQTYV